MTITPAKAAAIGSISIPALIAGIFFAVDAGIAKPPRFKEKLLKSKFELLEETDTNWQELATASNSTSIKEIQEWCEKSFDNSFYSKVEESVRSWKEFVNKCSKRKNFEARAGKLEVALFNQSLSKYKKLNRMIDMMQAGYWNLYSDIKAVTDAKKSDGTIVSKDIGDKYTKYCKDLGGLFWNKIGEGKTLEGEWLKYLKACADSPSIEKDYWQL